MGENDRRIVQDNRNLALAKTFGRLGNHNKYMHIRTDTYFVFSPLVSGRLIKYRIQYFGIVPGDLPLPGVK